MVRNPVVVVAGAAGRTGRLIVQGAIERGFKTRALIVRPFDPPNLKGIDDKELEILEGDFTSLPSLEKVMANADYLISAIGSTKPLSSKEFEKIDVQSNKMLALAAKAQNVEQMVVISSIGAGNSREALTCVFRILMTQVLKAKTRLEEEIKNSGICYTIIRPGGYTERALSGETAIGEGGKLSGLIQRQQVARTCLDVLGNPSMHHRTIEIVDKKMIKDEHQPYLLNQSSSEVRHV